MSMEHASDHGGFHIDPDTKRRIEAYARAACITPAELVRKAFEQYEATHEGEVTAYDLLCQAGLIGCLKNAAPKAPTDLATNPDHMKGFGSE